MILEQKRYFLENYPVGKITEKAVFVNSALKIHVVKNHSY